MEHYPMSSQKKIILHIPEKETKVIQEDSSDLNQRILTDIQDLEKKYSSMSSKIEDLTINHQEDDDLNLRNDLYDMNILMNEFEDKKLLIYKQKFQKFIHRLLKKFHKKKKKLVAEILELRTRFLEVDVLNKEYFMRLEFLEVAYNKIKIDYENLLQIKIALENQIAILKKNEVVMREEIERLAALLNSKEIECTAFKQKVDFLEIENQNLVANNRKLLGDLTLYEDENALLKSELEKLNHIYNDKMFSLNGVIESLQRDKSSILRELSEFKGGNFPDRLENEKLNREKEYFQNEIYNLQKIIKEKTSLIHSFQKNIEELERRPPKEIITEVPVTVEKIVEKPVENPLDKKLIAERNDIHEELRALKKVIYNLEQENYSLNESLMGMRSENENLIYELDSLKRKYFDLEEYQLRKLDEEKNILIQKNREGEQIIIELREKNQLMMNDIQGMKMANREKNEDIARHIEGLIRQNEYLEDLLRRQDYAVNPY